MKDKKRKNTAERDLIAWIRRRTRLDPRMVPIGPGDDAALVKFAPGGMLLAIDTIAEGVDFTLESATARKIGRKALAVNLSDIAAMGAEPLWCMASVTLTRGLPGAFGRDLYKGLEALSRSSRCPLVGGDVTTWTGGVTVTVAVGGAPAGKKPVSRAGARAGDLVVVTGTLGGSIEGKHLDFAPRLAEAAWLARNFPPTAMIDISDGLGVDSGHLARESGVAVVIDAARVPVSAAAKRLAARDGASPLAHAVADGEDFELLFTIAPRRVERMLAAKPFRTRLTVIGEVGKGRGAWLSESGRKRRIDSEGYEHLG